MLRRPVPLLLALAAVLAACGSSGAVNPILNGTGVKLHRIGKFDNPVWLTSAPGDRHRLFVVEKTGAVRVIRDGRVLARPFLDLRGRVSTGSEQGLLSIAFAPDYQRSHLVYADYTDTKGDSHIVEYRRAGASADRVDPRSARRVIFQRQPQPNHNGGLLLFGPDGLLYIGFGDGGGGFDQHGPHGNALNKNVMLGKILRIDPRRSGTHAYRIPAGNPFAGSRPGRGEIYAWGLRNPWRFSFDRRTNDLTIGDVGQNEWEEIDFMKAGTAKGREFGWRVWEANHRTGQSGTAPNPVFPVIEYHHDARHCSVTGGYVVRDSRLRGLYGRYVYGDFCGGEVESAKLAPGKATGARSTGLTVPELSSFAEDAAGHVYALSLAGPVYRLDPRG